jgi:hypothetical protein
MFLKTLFTAAAIYLASAADAGATTTDATTDATADAASSAALYDYVSLTLAVSSHRRFI